MVGGRWGGGGGVAHVCFLLVKPTGRPTVMVDWADHIEYIYILYNIIIIVL